MFITQDKQYDRLVEDPTLYYGLNTRYADLSIHVPMGLCTLDIENKMVSLDSLLCLVYTI